MSNPSNARIARLKKEFEGKTIERVEASSINVVHFHFSDGTRASIGADDTYWGIPVVGAEAWDGGSAKK